MSSPDPQDLGDWRGGAHEILISDPRLKDHRAFFRELAKLDPEEQNKRLERAAFANIRHHPAKFAKNIVANVSRLWFDFPFSAKQENLSTLFYLLPNVLLLGALVASGVAVASWKRLPVQVGAFAGFGLASLAVHAIVAGYPRMLMPVVPIVIAIAAYCLAGSRTMRDASRG
jgi:hypothetical protein